MTGLNVTKVVAVVGALGRAFIYNPFSNARIEHPPALQAPWSSPCPFFLASDFGLGTWEIAESLKGQAIFLPPGWFLSTRPANLFGVRDDCVYIIEFRKYIVNVSSFRQEVYT